MGALDGVQLHVVRTIDDLEACRQWAFERREGPLCVDTESSGLSPYRDHARLIQLGDLRHGWAAPVHGWGAGMMEIIARYPGPLGMHNSPYDWQVLEQEGMTPLWHKTEDTLLAGHIVDSLRLAALKPRAAQEVDPRAMAGEALLAEGMRAQHWSWATVPYEFEPYMMYSALDPVLTAHLWRKFAPAVTGEFRHVYDLERATARICAGMSRAGMMIDVPFIQSKITQIGDYYEKAMRWLRAEFGIETVNSNQQVGRAMNAAGIPTLVYTEGGQPSISKAAMKFYTTMYPAHAEFLQAIAWCRKADAITNRYLSKFLELAGSDDVMHYTIWSCKARTTRMSVTDPPMQTYDRDEPVIRGSYIPRPGHRFFTIDADQIEMRLAAHFSGDPRMIQMFREADESGISFFRLMTGQIYGSILAKSDPRYTWAKNASYGQLYGAGLEKAAATAGVPVDQMRPVYMGFQQMYPEVGRLMAHLIRQGKQGGRPQVRSLLGRRLYSYRGKEYALLNTQIQASAAEILKSDLVALEAAGFGPYLRLPMHDEFVVEAPVEYADDMLREASRILTNRTDFRVPITWDGKVLEREWKKT